MDHKKEPLGIRIFRGVQVQLLGQTAVFAASIIVTPRLIRGLGADGFALYTLIWTLLNYLSLFTLGTSTATQRYTALYTSQDEKFRLGRLLRAALLFQVLAACLAGGVNYALHGWIAHSLLNMDPRLVATASSVVACVSVALPFFFVMQFAVSVLYGRQKFSLHTLIYAGHMVVIATIAAALVASGRGLYAIVVSMIAVLAVLSALSLWLIRKTLWPGRDKRRKSDLREYFSYALKGFLAQVLWMISNQGDRIFIGALLPLTHMGFYVVASGIAQKLNVLCASVSATVFPVFTELYGKGETVKLRRVYLKANQLSLHLIFPIELLIFILAPQFLTLWISEEFSRMSTWPLRLLIVANIGYVLSMVPGSLANGMGAPHWYGIMQAGKVFLLLPLWFFCIPRWGIMGAAAGLAISEWAGSTVFMWHVNRRFLSIGLWEFWTRGCWRPVCSAAALALLGIWTHGAIGTWAGLFAYGAVGGALYAAVGYWTLDPEARELCAQWLARRTNLNA